MDPTDIKEKAKKRTRIRRFLLPSSFFRGSSAENSVEQVSSPRRGRRFWNNKKTPNKCTEVLVPPEESFIGGELQREPSERDGEKKLSNNKEKLDVRTTVGQPQLHDIYLSSQTEKPCFVREQIRAASPWIMVALIMAALFFFGRIAAVFCTCTFLYSLPRRRRRSVKPVFPR